MVRSSDSPFTSEENIRNLYLFVSNLLSAVQVTLNQFFGGYFESLVNHVDVIASEYAENEVIYTDFLEEHPPHDLEAITSADRTIMIQLINGMEERRRLFLNTFPLWIPSRLSLIDRLEAKAAELEENLKQFKKAKYYTSGLAMISGLLTPFLPVVTSAFSVVAAFGRFVTNRKEGSFVDESVARVQELINADKESFEEIIPWFESNARFHRNTEIVIGSPVYNYIFRKLNNCFDSERIYRNQEIDIESRLYLRNCFAALFDVLHKDHPRLPNFIKIRIAEYCLKFFILLSHPAIGYQWLEVASMLSKVKLYGAKALLLAHTGNECCKAYYGILNKISPTSSPVKSVIPNVYFGFIMNIAPLLYDWFNDTDKFESVERIKDLANVLRREMEVMEHIYDDVRIMESSTRSSSVYVFHNSYVSLRFDYNGICQALKFIFTKKCFVNICLILGFLTLIFLVFYQLVLEWYGFALRGLLVIYIYWIILFKLNQ